jgi:NinB protein
MSRQLYTLHTPEQRSKVAQIVAHLPKFSRVEIKGAARTLKQNDRLWAMLTDLSEQAEWAGQKRSTRDWKDLMTAAVKVAAGLEAVPGLEGGLMILGLHTSDMSVDELADVITYMLKWGDEHGVVWSDPKELATRDPEAVKSPSGLVAA